MDAAFLFSVRDSEPNKESDPWEYTSPPCPCFIPVRLAPFRDDDKDRGSFSLAFIPARCRLAGIAPAPGSRMENWRLQARRVWLKTSPVSDLLKIAKMSFWLLLHHERQASDCGWVKPCRRLNGKVRRKSHDQLHTPSPRAPKGLMQQAPGNRGFLLQPGTRSPSAHKPGKP